MAPRRVVVLGVRAEDPTQVTLAERDDVVGALAPDAAQLSITTYCTSCSSSRQRFYSGRQVPATRERRAPAGWGPWPRSERSGATTTGSSGWCSGRATRGSPRHRRALLHRGGMAQARPGGADDGGRRRCAGGRARRAHRRARTARRPAHGAAAALARAAPPASPESVAPRLVAAGGDARRSRRRPLAARHLAAPADRRRGGGDPRDGDVAGPAPRPDRLSRDPRSAVRPRSRLAFHAAQARAPARLAPPPAPHASQGPEGRHPRLQARRDLAHRHDSHPACQSHPRLPPCGHRQLLPAHPPVAAQRPLRTGDVGAHPRRGGPQPCRRPRAARLCGGVRVASRRLPPRPPHASRRLRRREPEPLDGRPRGRGPPAPRAREDRHLLLEQPHRGVVAVAQAPVALPARARLGGEGRDARGVLRRGAQRAPAALGVRGADVRRDVLRDGGRRAREARGGEARGPAGTPGDQPGGAPQMRRAPGPRRRAPPTRAAAPGWGRATPRGRRGRGRRGCRSRR